MLIIKYKATPSPTNTFAKCWYEGPLYSGSFLMSVRDSLFVEHPIDVLQCNPSIVATIQAFGEQDFFLYRGVTLSQWLICTKRVHLGHSKVSFIEGCPNVRVV